jgi:hypothetical protein
MNLSILDSKPLHSPIAFAGVVLGSTITVLALIMALVEPLATEGIRHLSPFRYQLLLTEEAAPTVRALAIGDSHTGLGFLSPDPRVRSVGFAGETIPETALKVRYLRQKFPSLSVIALQVQPHMFFPHRNIAPKPAYITLLNGRGVFHPFEHSLRQFDPCCRGSMPKIAFYHLIGFPLPKPVPEIGQNGYLLYPLDAVPPGTRLEQAEREIRSYGSTTPVPQLREAFEQLIDDLLTARLQVVLVRYPFSPEYLALMPTEAMGEADTFIKSLSQKRGLTVCGTWDVYTEQGYFFNADHLNDEGARHYWPTIARCLAPHIPGLKLEASTNLQGLG